MTKKQISVFEGFEIDLEDNGGTCAIVIVSPDGDIASMALDICDAEDIRNVLTKWINGYTPRSK